MTPKQKRILVVDDTIDNILVLREILLDEYTVIAASNGSDALAIASNDPKPDCILLDVLMPGMDGYEVCRRLKANDETRNIPVLFVTTLSDEEDESRGLELGAVDYITKPIRPAVVLSRIRNHLNLKEYQDHLMDEVEKRTKEIVKMQDVTIYSLAALAETRDNELSGHFRRTQHVSEILAHDMTKHPSYLDFFRKISVDILCKSIPLHDVGKVGTPDHILFKPGRLTAEEFEVMKLHTVHGRDILQRAEDVLNHDSFLSLASDIAYTHHEKWDGSGYPQGLSGESIPISGRIMAVVDVYDALISNRVYKQPMPHSKAVEIILEGRGAHFDPTIVDIFMAHKEEIRKISLEFADCDSEREALQA